MFVCASTSVVFDARKVSMTRHRLADDERWAMLNKTTFQEILNAILVQSTFPLPHQPPPPPSSAFRAGQRSATFRQGTRGGGGERKEGTATRFCFGGERNTDLAPPPRENSEISTRIAGDEREKDRCRGGSGTNDLHLTKPSTSSSSAAATVAAGGLTSTNISASLQKNLPIGPTSSPKISDLQRRNPAKSVSMRLAYSAPLQSPHILPSVAPHHSEHKGAARKCSLGVACTHRQIIRPKDGAGNENSSVKDRLHISPLSNPDDQEKPEDLIGNWSRDPIPETRGSRSSSSFSSSSQEGATENEDFESVNRSEEDRREKEKSEDADLDVPATKSVDPSGLLRDRVDHGTTSSDPPPVVRLDPSLGATGRTLLARNPNEKSSDAEIIGRRQPAFADDRLQEEEEKEEEEGLKRSSEWQGQGQGQVSVAIGNYQGGGGGVYVPSELMKENGAFGLPWSRWIAMDKDVLLCIIEHVLNVDIFGSKTTTQMFSLTKNNNNNVERTPLRRTERYPIAGHPENLQWSGTLRACHLPEQTADSQDIKGTVECQKLSDDGCGGVRAVSRGTEEMKPNLQLPRRNNQRNTVHTDNTTANTVSAVSNIKPPRRARSGVLLLRRKRRGLGPSSRSLRLGNNSDSGGGPVEGNAGAARPADCDAAAHDKSHSSFKWKSEMITRLIHETKSRQDLSAVS